MARGKSWRKEEDLSLVRAIVRVLQDAGTLERGAIAFWARVTSLYEELLADEHAPPRTPGAVESRWKNLQASIAGFVKCLASASRGDDAGLPETERVNAAMKLYREKDPKKNAFENLEVWECLRKEMPLYEDFVSSSTSFYMMQKKREGVMVGDDDQVGSNSSNKKKHTSMSVYDAEAALLGRDTTTPPATATPVTVTVAAANTNGARLTARRALVAGESNHEEQRPMPVAVAVPSPRQSLLRPTAAQTAPAPAPAPAPTTTRETTEILEQKAKYWKAMQEAAETRNTLLAEQNAIAAEKNMVMLFASRDDAVSTEFFDLKRRIALAKLKRDFADFLR